LHARDDIPTSVPLYCLLVDIIYLKSFYIAHTT